jgi:hypothetical protein
LGSDIRDTAKAFPPWFRKCRHKIMVGDRLNMPRCGVGMILLDLEILLNVYLVKFLIY